jgi:hypothetical protein
MIFKPAEDTENQWVSEKMTVAAYLNIKFLRGPGNKKEELTNDDGERYFSAGARGN